MSPDPTPLSDADWEQLCADLEPVTAAEQPYERIRVAPDEDRFSGYVEEPRPDHSHIPNDADAEAWKEAPSNDIGELSSEISAVLREKLEALHTARFSTTTPDAASEPHLKSVVLTPDTLHGVYSVKTELSADNDLYQQFRELMVTLDFVESPEEIAQASEVQAYNDSDSSRDADLGLGATTYKWVSEPHTLWKNCDTMEDYIDMLVENGADRAELEAQDEYLHHFHPQTWHLTLDEKQAEALETWKDSTEAVLLPAITLKTNGSRSSISRVSFAKDGSGELEATVVASTPDDASL